jgi:hypothetical protein
MAIYRHPPGTSAPWAGPYVLVGHFGESTGITVDCNQGDQLPLTPATDGIGPLWYVYNAESAVDAKAA